MEIFVILSACLIGQALGYFSAEKIQDQVSISYNGIELMRDSAEFPILTMGTGSFEATDSQGNFEITDEISTMVNFTAADPVEDNDGGLTVNFMSVAASSDTNVCLRLAKNGEITVDWPNTNLQLNSTHLLNRWFLRLLATDEEYIWGGGEQYSFLNLREGENYPIWVREQGVGRNKSSALTQVMDVIAKAGGDYHTTYWPQPSFLSSRGYHMELTFPSYSELRFSPKYSTNNQGHVVYWHHSINQENPCYRCKIVITSEGSLMETVKKINPGQPELPEWIYNGALIGVQGGTERMLDILKQMQDNGVAVNGLWIQDWSGKITTEFGTRVFWNWKWNSTWYPDLDKVIQRLKDEQDIRVTAYITPHLNIDGDVYQDHAQDSSLWIKNADDGSILSQDFGQFNVSTVDIMTPDPDCNCLNTARTWYKDLIKSNLIDLGLSGWMADFGEYTPMNAKTNFYGRWWTDEYNEILHNLLPQHWASLNREAVSEAGQLGEIIYWMRSGGIDSKYHQVMSWAGDQTVDWTKSDGLPSSIIASLSLAVSGMGLSHSDIGGYTSIPQLGEYGPVRDTELLLRWAEYSVFTPMMRTHETNKPGENAQVYDNPETMKKFGRLTQIYKTLKPYIKNAVSQNAKEGKPVMRPLFLQYQDDKIAYDQEYQYMFGDDLLVAPVLEPGIERWQVYLPGPDDWVWFWDQAGQSDMINGNQWIEVYAPLGFTPAFYRFNSEFSDLFKQIALEFGAKLSK